MNKSKNNNNKIKKAMKEEVSTQRGQVPGLSSKMPGVHLRSKG